MENPSSLVPVALGRAAWSVTQMQWRCFGKENMMKRNLTMLALAVAVICAAVVPASSLLAKGGPKKKSTEVWWYGGGNLTKGETSFGNIHWVLPQCGTSQGKQVPIVP